MDKVYRRELLAVIAAAIMLVVFLLPALRFARREQRDNIRRDEVASDKIELEQYFNKYETYPLKFNASPHDYVVVMKDEVGATGWFVRARLENHHDDKAGFDEEQGRNYYYRYVNPTNSTFYEVCGGELRCDFSGVRE
ncbi:MAG: hypothetical protein U1C49_02470 [Candidatus Andersenbacteria bacterium]|nr:hypothetical protein [bacterium]MDZ4225692.1 hypothetical protein [Candidatus Andersenbacteria bacterium]